MQLRSEYAQLGNHFGAPAAPQKPKDAQLLAWNTPLAQKLDLPALGDDEKVNFFSGNGPYETVSPFAMRYAGHQFGQFVPQLGDGRAHLLGEWQDPAGQSWDIHLKGSGRTPFSRGGDGLAWLGPVMREYLISEAMAALGIPTTRALAMCSTGDSVYRETLRPGAVITRVAKSFVRVGSFEYFAARKDIKSLKQLYDFTSKRLNLAGADPQEFFRHVANSQIQLIVRWLGVGFVHGVMNTDNTSLSGETIDYGPCAFLDSYHPDRRFSSIDHHGRYGFMSQKNIIFWNLANLASCLMALSDDHERSATEYSQMLQELSQDMETQFYKHFARKLGFSESDAHTATWVDQFLSMMQETDADFTLSFNALRGKDNGPASNVTTHPEFNSFKTALETRWKDQSDDPQTVMASVNPVKIPRNHLVERIIEAGLNDDFSLFFDVLESLKTPYDSTDDDRFLPPKSATAPYVTYCGT